jgi:hypothetical protein
MITANTDMTCTRDGLCSNAHIDISEAATDCSTCYSKNDTFVRSARRRSGEIIGVQEVVMYEYSRSSLVRAWVVRDGTFEI